MSKIHTQQREKRRWNKNQTRTYTKYGTKISKKNIKKICLWEGWIWITRVWKRVSFCHTNLVVPPFCNSNVQSHCLIIWKLPQSVSRDHNSWPLTEDMISWVLSQENGTWSSLLGTYKLGTHKLGTCTNTNSAHAQNTNSAHAQIQTRHPVEANSAHRWKKRIWTGLMIFATAITRKVWWKIPQKDGQSKSLATLITETLLSQTSFLLKGFDEYRQLHRRTEHLRVRRPCPVCAHRTVTGGRQARRAPTASGSRSANHALLLKSNPYCQPNAD